jgi:hypothetical protein
MKFIMGDEQKEESEGSENDEPMLPNQGSSEILKLKEYHEVLFVALVDSVTKSYKSLTYFKNKEHLTAQERSEILCDIYLQFLS